MRPQMLQQLKDRAATGNFIVQHDHVPIAHLADQRGDAYRGVINALLGGSGHGQAQTLGKGSGIFGIAQIGRHHHRMAEIVRLEMGRQLIKRMQLVNRHAEKPVHLRRMQRHGQHAIGARRGQQIGHQTATQRDARRVFLVRAGIGKIGDDSGDARRRGAAGRIEHEQQLHQIVLHRRAERLDDEHILLAAIGLQLHFQTIIGKALEPGRLQGDAEMGADLLGKFGMGAAAENR